MDSDRDLYQILQVDPAAEPEVVQAAFKRLALKYHPDKNLSPDANRRMQELNEAYAIISDPAQRAAYDQQRRAALAAQRRSEEEAHYRAEAERRAEAARQRKEQMAAQRRAENERQEKVRAAAAQRRVEYEQQIRAQMAAQMRAKRERQQREWEQQQAGAQQTAAQSAAAVEMPIQEPVAISETQGRVDVEPSPIDMPAQEPVAISETQVRVDVGQSLNDVPAQEHVAMPEAQVQVEVEQRPIDLPRPSESERRQNTLLQSRQALQNEIFKLDYGLTDAAEQVKYWSSRRIPWEIVVPSGQGMNLLIGGVVTIIALLLAGFTLALGGGISWVACVLVGIGAGWWTWRTCVSVMPAGYLVEALSEIKRSRELQRRKLKAELAQLESTMQAEAGASTVDLNG